MDYIQRIIEEQLANKRLLASLFEKWKTEKPQLSETEVESIVSRFGQLKNGLDREKPQVATFLFRYDGTDYPKFQERFLKDITKYSYSQIIFLLSEYTAGEEGLNLEVDDNFGKLSSNSSDEYIQRSKEMWDNCERATICEEGFRVHYIPNQKTSIQFGYYYHYLNNKKDDSNNTSNWCVTWRKNDNYWSSYRNNRTFYFIIDESKKNGPNSQYYIAALQRDTSTHDGYRLTDYRNNGDNTKSWNEIISLFPQLENYKELITPKHYNPDDELQKEGDNILNRITEEPGLYEFKRQPKNIKRNFIVAGKFIQKPESWASMDTEIRKIYINTTTAGNYRSKFASYELFMEVRKSNLDTNTLDHRLKTQGLDGIITLYEYLRLSQFRVSKTNIENPNIKIYRNRVTNKLGIFDAGRVDWYSRGGITYDDKYDESKPKLYKNAENPTEKFFVITYTRLGIGDDKNFYCVIPIARSKTSGYLLSAEAFGKLKERIVENDFMGTLPSGPEDNSDIN